MGTFEFHSQACRRLAQPDRGAQIRHVQRIDSDTILRESVADCRLTVGHATEIQPAGRADIEAHDPFGRFACEWDLQLHLRRPNVLHKLHWLHHPGTYIDTYIVNK